MKQLFILILFISSNISFSQEVIGTIFNSASGKLEGVNISLAKTTIGTTSDQDGSFNLKVSPNKKQTLFFSFIGYKTKSINIPMLKMGQTYKVEVNLQNAGININNVTIEDEQIRNNTFQKVDAKLNNTIPTASGGVEALIKTLPGVSSSNELSSQYSVRGGNFDENLVYVNGIEVYRPFLIRSGQQEGLSFINSDLVSAIQFSAGGFSAKYGDKMSSVLDITYKKPKKFAGSATMSLLGANLHLEGVNKSKKLSFIVGARNKANQYLLNSLETQGEYQPNFSDIQSFINYDFSEKLSMNILFNFSKNTFKQVPQTKTTRFGTVDIPLELFIYFEGQEVDEYETYFGAYQTTYKPNDNLNLSLTVSAFETYESETFDILGQYYLSQVDGNLASEDFGEAIYNIGVGTHLNHARNYLKANVFNIEHKGLFINNDFEFRWGLKSQMENIQDEISEYTLIDSSSFSLPHPSDNIGGTITESLNFELEDVLKTSIELNSLRHSGYMEMQHKFGGVSLNSGIRTSYWDLNEEFIFSPRTSISYVPYWDRDVLFRFSTGIYYQTPFYRELRDFDGKINRDIQSQKSTHFVLGSDYNFKLWQRPFKLVTELYYKDLKNLIPYDVENVRIRYYATNSAVGYSTGFDLRLNGEFIKGLESWASLSILKTEADIIGDTYVDDDGNIQEIGFYRRPTDQRFNFSLFFQDYLPKNPNFKVHLNLVYGSRIPLTAPDSYKGQYDFSLPDYKRVDIGFSAIIKKEGAQLRKYNPFKYTKSAWVSLEVFNILDIDNTISYLWVQDTSGLQIGVPNRLTSRLINLKLHLDF
jgi:hypothetical protein